MNDKSYIFKSNSPNVYISEDKYMQSSDIKLEPTDSHDFSNDQRKYEKQGFHMLESTELGCIKIETTVEEDADGGLQLQNVYNATEIKGNVDNYDIVDNCDSKSLRMKNIDVEKQEYAGISSTKVEKMDESYGTDNSIDNIYNTNQIEG